MNVAIIGTGYVGLVTGAGLASAGNRVTCIDSDSAKIDLLRRGQVPFVEPGLPELVAAGIRAGRLNFTDRLLDGCRSAAVIILAVGTPSNEDGEADLTALRECARRLADMLRDDCVVVVKSTVPPGTCQAMQEMFNGRHPSGRSCARIASNPEFLAEGSAVEDFCRPARIVVGADDADTIAVLESLYAPFDPDGTRTLTMDLRTAEFAKYACNAMLAARLAAVNELANIADGCEADIPSVFRVVGADPRIGGHYLHPGPGFGGSCLPKDLRALRDIATRHGEDSLLLQSVERVNLAQLDRLMEAIGAVFPDGLEGRLIALWGLAFKPGTDDVRESPALRLLDRLLARGARLQVFDPAVTRIPQAENAGLTAHAGPAEACNGAELLCVMTRWPEFLDPDWRDISARMHNAAVLDPHFLYDPAAVRQAGLRYLGSGSRSTTWTYSGMRFSGSTWRPSNSSSAAP